MSLAIAVLAITIFASGCASVRPQADPAHFAYLAAAAADTATTQSALARGGTEMNPLLGENPSVGRVVALKAVTFMGLRSVENRWQRKLGRRLKWYEKALVWGLPIAVQGLAAKLNSDQ